MRTLDINFFPKVKRVRWVCYCVLRFNSEQVEKYPSLLQCNLSAAKQDDVKSGWKQYGGRGRSILRSGPEVQSQAVRWKEEISIKYKSKLTVLFGAYSISCWIQLLLWCLLGLFSAIRCADCFTFLFFLQTESQGNKKVDALRRDCFKISLKIKHRYSD